MSVRRCLFRLSVGMPAVLLIVMVMALSAPALAQAEPLPAQNVLILNSYHKGFAWTDDQSSGIEEELRKAEQIPVIYSEYMDWKRYPTSDNLEHFYQMMKVKYENVHIDAILTTDDSALDFAVKYRHELLNDAPIIFSGVNQLDADQIHEENITGVIEEVDPTETLEMARELNPSLRNVYVVTDNSDSGVSTRRIIMDKLNALNIGLRVYSLNRLSNAEILQKASTLSSDSILLMATYFSDAAGTITEFDRFSSELGQHSRVPVYHIYDFSLNHGAFGGSMLSGKHEGQTAAGMALKVLAGTTPGDIPVARDHGARKVFDYNELNRYHISLKDLPEGSEVINKPFSFYETYKLLVLSIIGVFLVLLAFIIVLLFYVRLVRRMRTKLEKSNERFSLATRASDAVIWDVDMTTMIYYFSDSWYELLGYERDEIGEQDGGWREIIHPDDREQEERMRMKHLEGLSSYYHCEYRMRSKSGEYIWFQARGKVLRNEEGGNVRFAGSMTDVTERKDYENKLQTSYQELESTYEELTALQDELLEQYNKVVENQALLQNSEEKYRHLAYNDMLSGLPNRLSLNEELQQFIEHNPEGNAALFFMDIDNFKYINDTMGHTFGDDLLVRAGKRLLKLADGRSKYYRFGGDEFVILRFDIRNQHEVIAYAQTLVEAFEEPFELNASCIHLSASIGVAQYPDNGQSAEELLKNADIAMYRAKEAGKERYVLYGQAMQQHFDERMVIEKHLRHAIANQELSLNYQPLVALRSGEVWGFEALLRWHNPVLGFVSPLSFIRVAEDCRLIVPIGEWVLRTACRFIKELHEQGYEGYRVSVNISVVQLMLEDFTECVLAILEETGLAPEYLELEITESIFMESFEAIGAKLEILRDMGIGIALDDFGTGYSSLSYLRQLPITTLKIDKSFIDSMDKEDPTSLAGSIITIGHNLGLQVTAEGVETVEQLAVLEQMDCDKIQGYFISRPIAEHGVAEWLAGRSRSIGIS